ncbi:macrophage mannose receptor 1 [Megalobrama amblycephala]|uniref:macrophage mannose receptor 1 n=1 Tax=Megalobrama amblycephala TaxID=75352 RepID=UPI00201406D3|nr:macrophage mannose receptor 1 [Megalobrama amblycephala]
MKISLSFRRVVKQTRRPESKKKQNQSSQSALTDLSSAQQDRVMEQRLLLILMICGVYCVTGTLNPSKLICFVNQPKTFDEAQQYCRDNYIDLVTLSDRAELEELFALENFTYTEYAWIGLKKTSHYQWRWALADQEFYKEGETEYRNWGPGEPTNYGGEYCSVMDDNGKFRDTQCEPSRTFVCYNGQNYNEHKYNYINEPKPWREAQRYCRQFHTDLVSVRNQDENLQVQQLIPAGQVTYIGLFQDAFAWYDNSTSSFRNWDSAQPDGSGECVAQHLQDHRLWDDQSCGSPRPFFCYAIPVFKQVLKLEVESDQNVNDPDVKATILEEIQQRLISHGMPEQANLQWRQQANGNVFQRTEKVRELI